MSGTIGGNPHIPQGNLNRLIGSLTFPANTPFNITASFLGTEGISLNPGGPVTTMLGTLTGAVRSPEPYMLMGVAVHLIRAQPLAEAFKSRIESDSNLGNGVFRPDTTAMSPWDLINVSITEVRPFAMTGRDAGFMLTLTGVWAINNNLWG